MPNYLGKEARALRPSQLLPRWHELQQNRSRLKQTVEQRTQQLSDNPAEFFEQTLGFKPYDYQKEFAETFEKNQFMLPTGTGKAAKLKPYPHSCSSTR